MSLPNHNCYLRTKVDMLWLSFLAVFHLASPVKLAVSCTKILLTFRMRPTAITLNYSVMNIWNDVRQIIINIYIEKLQFNSLVWGSLTLIPNMYRIWDVMPGVPWEACWVNSPLLMRKHSLHSDGCSICVQEQQDFELGGRGTG